MFAKGRLTLVAFLALVMCSQAISTLTYTFPNTITDVYTTPGYSLGTLNAGFTLEVILTIPGLTTGAPGLDALTVEVIDAQTRVVNGGDTTEITGPCIAGSVECTRKWTIEVAKAYYLKIYDAQVAPLGTQATTIEYFTVSAFTYNSTLTSYVGSPNNIELLKLTEVVRNSVVKLLYISKPQTNLKFNLYPVPEITPNNPDPAFNLNLFYIGTALPTNNFLYTGLDLFAALLPNYASATLNLEYLVPQLT